MGKLLNFLRGRAVDDSPRVLGCRGRDRSYEMTKTSRTYVITAKYEIKGGEIFSECLFTRIGADG